MSTRASTRARTRTRARARAAATLAAAMTASLATTPAAVGVADDVAPDPLAGHVTAELVADIDPQGSGQPMEPVVLGDLLLFRANTPAHGWELWRSDGEGAELVADIAPGTRDAEPRDLTVLGDHVYFSAAESGSDAREVWRSDGLTVERVTDINPTGSSRPYGFTALGDWLYFTADDGVTGSELWRTDGTTTEQVADINPAGGGEPGAFTVLGDWLHFRASDGVHGFELWRSNGVVTEMVADINPRETRLGSLPAAGMSEHDRGVELAGWLYYSASGPGYVELYRTDGVTTELVSDGISVTDEASFPTGLVAAGNWLYFLASDRGPTGRQLWRTDGTTTERVTDTPARGVGGHVEHDGELWFLTADDASGTAVWRVGDDGDPVQVHALVREDGTPWPSGYGPFLHSLGGALWLYGDDGTHGYEPWRVEVDGVRLVRDITPGQEGSYASDLVAFDGTVYFRASDPDHSSELWRIAPAVAPWSEFADVPPGHPFFTEIMWAVTSGITTGYDDDTYRPTADVSRQAMAAFLYRAAGRPAFTPPAEPTFTDVPAEHPFFAEIEWLVERGVTTGWDDGTFRPTATVSRQATAAFLHRLAGSPEVTLPTEPTFSDVGVGHPFRAPVEWLVAEGIATGYAGGTFGPTATVSRQAMAAFLHRYAHR